MSDILALADDSDGFEVPNNDWSNFPWKELQRDVSAIHEEIEQNLGVNLQRDNSVQDASFFEELRVLNPSSYLSKGVIRLIPDIAIRFSNFGRLYTIYSATESLADYPVEGMRTIIDSHGWHFVSLTDLEKPYDGKNIKLREAKITWWVRFFDYL